MGEQGVERRMHVSFSVQKMNVFPLCLIIFGNGWYVRDTGCPRRVGALILSLWIGTCANGGVWYWRNTSPLGHEGWQHHACHTRGHILLTLSYCLALLLLSRFSRVRLCVTPQTAAHQAPPSLGFSRQEHWSGLPFHSPMHEREKWKWSRSVMSDP